MESSQVTQLIGYLENQNIKVKAEALSIILQFTGKKDQREQLRKSEITRHLLRCVPEPELNKSALAILINFSQDSNFVDEFLPLNGIKRTIENLKENLIQYGKFVNDPGNLTKEEKTAKEDKLLAIIQLELLLLSNLSQNDEVKKQILELDREPDFHGLTFSFMLSWFNHPTISPTFHFFASILANLSSVKETREFIMQPKIKLLENIVNNIYSVESNRRLGCIRTIRNCLFDYEDEKTLEYLIDPKINLLNTIIKCMLINVAKALSTDPDYDKEYDETIDMGKKYGLNLKQGDDIANIHTVMDEMDILVDSLLIVTNVDQDKHKLEFDAKLLRFVIENSKLIFHSESLGDKLDVISVQLLKENTM